MANPPKPWKAEYAKSGRSSCKACKDAIAKDQFRLGKMVAATQFDGFMPMWNHASCIFKKGNQIKSLDDVEGYDLLRWDDQQNIRKYVEGGLSSAAAVANDECAIEVSQTSRAACRRCNQKIMKGTVRVSTKPEGQGAKGLAWHHVNCFVEMSPSTNLEKIYGWDTLSLQDKETIFALVKKDVSGKKADEHSQQATSKGTKRKKGDGNNHACKVPRLEESNLEGGISRMGNAVDSGQSSSNSNELERKLKEQSDALWKIKDELKKHVILLPYLIIVKIINWLRSMSSTLTLLLIRIGLLNWRKFSHLKEKESSISMHLTERNSRTRCCCGMPYEDDTSNSGLQVTNLDWLLNATLESDRSGLQVAIRAIGDKANDMVLDLFNSVASLHGMRDRRFRIEHAQHLAPGTAKRFGQQRVIASVQPDHLLDDANSAGKKLGEDRALRSSYLFKSLLDADTHLAFGSDWPVADVNPLGSIRTALYRVPPGWESSWNPSESVELNDAIKAQTISAAYACFLDHSLGSLSPGKYADFVVLPASSWDELVDEIPSSVLATYVNGKQAYP